MVKQHKIHRGIPAWKRDILLLNCILRLRAQPSVPYAEIASILLESFPTPFLRLYENSAQRELKESYKLQGIEGTLPWLGEWLEEKFDYAEQWGSEPWHLAIKRDGEEVSEILRICNLVAKGYAMVSEADMLLQIEWRRERDWRAGSEALGRFERLAVGDVSTGKFAVGPPDLMGEEKFTELEEKTVMNEAESAEVSSSGRSNDWELLGRLRKVTEKYHRDPPILEPREQQKRLKAERGTPEAPGKQLHQMLGLRRVESTLVDPTAGVTIRFDTPQDPFRFSEQGLGKQHLS